MMGPAIVLASIVVATAIAIVFYLLVGDLIDKRRKRLAMWQARTLVGTHTSEVQIQHIYISNHGREYVMKRQSLGSIYAADAEYDEQVAKLMTKARTRAFDMNMGD